jgi:hypothetical protein
MTHIFSALFDEGVIEIKPCRPDSPTQMIATSSTFTIQPEIVEIIQHSQIATIPPPVPATIFVNDAQRKGESPYCCLCRNIATGRTHSIGEKYKEVIIANIPIPEGINIQSISKCIMCDSCWNHIYLKQPCCGPCQPKQQCGNHVLRKDDLNDAKIYFNNPNQQVGRLCEECFKKKSSYLSKIEKSIKEERKQGAKSNRGKTKPINRDTTTFYIDFFIGNQKLLEDEMTLDTVKTMTSQMFLNNIIEKTSVDWSRFQINQVKKRVEINDKLEFRDVINPTKFQPNEIYVLKVFLELKELQI